MIEPFAGPAGLAPRVDSSAAPRKAAPESSFAGLLGAGDGAGRGREGEARAAAETVGMPLEANFETTPNGSELAVAAPEGVAERFNEHGFFGQAVPASRGDVDAGIGGTGAPAGLAAPVRAEPLVHVDARGAGPEATVVRLGLATEADAGRAPAFPPAHSGVTSITASRVATGGPVPVPTTGAGGEEPASTGAVPSHGRRLLGAAAARAAQSATRVAISETGRGVDVAAFVQALPADEQGRLRDEIAALLSRHGLRPDRIHIVARQSPRASA